MKNIFIALLVAFALSASASTRVELRRAKSELALHINGIRPTRVYQIEWSTDAVRWQTTLCFQIPGGASEWDFPVSQCAPSPLPVRLFFRVREWSL